jgi:hypothetical protein
MYTVCKHKLMSNTTILYFTTSHNNVVFAHYFCDSVIVVSICVLPFPAHEFQLFQIHALPFTY